LSNSPPPTCTKGSGSTQQHSLGLGHMTPIKRELERERHPSTTCTPEGQSAEGRATMCSDP
jgi:hypothetical protein